MPPPSFWVDAGLTTKTNSNTTEGPSGPFLLPINRPSESAVPVFGARAAVTAALNVPPSAL
jgi:hypothetical protein